MSLSYTGRFAPSPTGPMHLGSVVAALASWLDARAHGLLHGNHRQQWLVRIEDTDRHRCQPGADHEILRQLQALGLQPDAPPLWQSHRHAAYQQALDTLRAQGMAYACQCSRKEIEAIWQARGATRSRFATLPYPGTCRDRADVEPLRTWRFRTDRLLSGATAGALHWQDRRLGPQQQDVAQEVGDFALWRGDGMWSYQLACVTDDAAQGVTHIVRGADLLDNTARQIRLQQALGHARPQYLHIPLALDALGEKLSKSNGAASVDVGQPAQVLQQAASVLGLSPVVSPGQAMPPSQALAQWVQQWAGQRFFAAQS